ncbi:MAG: hypothetical protein JJE07_11955 [Flavobacteriaceae bacterium]|nr:hypothetical protein [Flavobacteriaceae bacterium]
MKAASVKELKQELNNCSQQELLELCLRLSKFKKENKELLTYLLFESYDEAAYIENVKIEIDIQFDQINRKTYYFIKKGVQKILRELKKYIRYSQKKETEIDLLIYFCLKLKNFSPSINKNVTLQNLYQRQIGMIEKAVATLHEDLQSDYELELEELSSLK